MVRFLYFFFSLFVLSCGQTSLDEDIQAMNAQELEAYNQEFRKHSIDYYARARKIKTTLKAQGGGNLSLQEFDLLKTLVEETNIFIHMRLTNLSIPELGENRVKKEEIESSIIPTLNNLKSFPSRDLIHQTYKKNERIDYQRNYSEEEFEDDISRYINKLTSGFDHNEVILTKVEATELLINAQSILYLAERKALLFLLESLEFGMELNPVIKSEVRSDYEGVVHHTGEKINLDLQPLVLFESSLLSHQYRLFFEDTEEIYDLKGSISPRVDTIWLPTDKVGNYRIEGQSIQDGRHERSYEWKFEYKVIEP